MCVSDAAFIIKISTNITTYEENFYSCLGTHCHGQPVYACFGTGEFCTGFDGNSRIWLVSDAPGGGRFKKDISATAPRYVYSAETAKDGKYYFASDAAQKSDATAFVYVDNTDGKYAIKSINGKWGDFVAISSSSNTKPATYDIIQMDKNNTALN